MKGKSIEERVRQMWATNTTGVSSWDLLDLALRGEMREKWVARNDAILTKFEKGGQLLSDRQASYKRNDLRFARLADRRAKKGVKA
jgi:hypothetical protein